MKVEYVLTSILYMRGLVFTKASTCSVAYLLKQRQLSCVFVKQVPAQLRIY